MTPNRPEDAKSSESNAGRRRRIWTGDRAPSRTSHQPRRDEAFVQRRPPLSSNRWNPTQLEAPMANEDADSPSIAVRCAETCRYIVRKAEYWLSRDGTLREWLRLILRPAVGLLALLIPVGLALLLVTLLLPVLQGVLWFAGLFLVGRFLWAMHKESGSSSPSRRDPPQ